jgi:hypothetical protein
MRMKSIPASLLIALFSLEIAISGSEKDASMDVL